MNVMNVEFAFCVQGLFQRMARRIPDFPDVSRFLERLMKRKLLKICNN